jgi:hypothetical protein
MHCLQFVAAGILPAVSSGIPAAPDHKDKPTSHDLASTSDRPAGRRRAEAALWRAAKAESRGDTAAKDGCRYGGSARMCPTKPDLVKSR